ncbi:MAG TPA: thiopeptide-type bacteriocin biosynthesis protein [Candidatus Polarisedimenticolaceae bacterium]|nr:thiopeptide-type bacteriocin biosynthesis protein [Candidatus Polarisedimenticolaceae bacterium]
MSTPERCLYTLVHAPQERHDVLLEALVHPVVQGIRDHPGLRSLFFARYNQPDWQLRFRVLGTPGWVDGPVRAALEARLPGLRAEGLLESWEFATYQREWRRYGGERGMRLCERIFLHDSLACLDLLHEEGEGTLETNRREYALVFTERFLDLLGLQGDPRLAVYRKAFGWAMESGDWSEADRGLLEERYRGMRGGLADLVRAEEPALARRCLAACQPAIEALRQGLRDGTVQQDPSHLAWSLTHMHCNRIGLDVHAEAVLRYFAWRLHQDQAVALGIGDRPE